MEPPAPPSLPARPLSKAPPPRQASFSVSDQVAAPALPPKPSIRRRPQPPHDPASFTSPGPTLDLESDAGRGPYALQNHPTGTGPSATDGVFPDYSRSNRRLPLFSDVIGIHDIQQKSHGVRAFSISNEQVATATSNIRIYSVLTGENISSYGHEKDTKPTALMFTQSRRPDSLGQYLWAGWSEGSLQVIDTKTREVVEKKRAAHKGGCITQIIRCKTQVWTVDDTGSVFVWQEDTMLGRPTIQAPLQSLTIPPKQVCAIAVQDMLWSSDGVRIHVMRVGPDAGRPRMAPISMDVPYGIGPLTCMATIAGSGQVFSGHEDGKVIIWSIESREKVRIINVHAYRIMSLLGVGSYLWAGFATGKIYVLDLRPEVPVVMKDWQAHKESGVAILQLDEEGLILGSRHQVGSCAENGEIKIWDGLMAKDRQSKRMVDRSKEYCQWRDLKVLICSWNIDASKPAAQDVNGGADRRLFESWLTGMDQEGPPDIISVGFQEIVDLESKKMTAKSLLKGSKRAETETISKQYKRWQIYLTNKIRELYSPMGVNFKLLECSNLVGLFSCVFVRDQEWNNIRSEWTHVDMVKTGLKGYHGNKGGIATRFIIDDTSISFVNCHLAAGQSHTRQRNTDAANVLKKLTHPNPAISSETVHPEVFWFGDGTMAMDHEICFLSGDLNYRIDVKFSDAVARVQAQDWAYLHQHDQLLLQKLKNPQFVLRAFNESELLFAPTYKYDPGTDTYDTSSKHRTPAWCDRILWRGRHVRQLFYKRNECRVSDHRPISGGFVVGVKRIDEAQRRVVEQQVKEGWHKVQEKEIRIKKLAWLRSWGWIDTRVEGILDREGGDLAHVVRILSADQ
ncbi:Endonuclease/exonuclease/phosphatase [Gamsiella multidivaricata]|uniref:Endonuclease/exonuclease/phosphatase n=1 Tax=Gamsiella multidivaricata TaxID=101098 RepID=UPI00221E861F|nr:Endonuclease/exonuclease/phosphatase [Gamsiella multidivaricata]KAI7826579.1 Endonuclease/exonuclease/phosphatase [Gamsiella multidivaricata]